MHSFKSFAVALTTTVSCLALAAPSEVLAQTTDVVFGQNVASVTYGPYVRLEFGGANHDLTDAYWLPPGWSRPVDPDPQVNFEPVPGDDWRGLGAAAIGYDWQNGFRADVSLFSTGKITMTAPCSSASDGTNCNTHADITDASLESRGVMANLFYAPLEARGSNAILQPFIVAGLGVARNEVGPWTRTKNPENEFPDRNPERTFSGNSSTDPVWSVGVGASLQLTRPGQWPVILEAAYRYYDYGSVSGGVDPRDNGESPQQGFTLDHTDNVISLAIRVPLTRY